jgi:hypothetical protein
MTHSPFAGILLTIRANPSRHEPELLHSGKSASDRFNRHPILKGDSMPITVSWHDDEHTIMVFNYGSAWDWEDFGAAIDQAYKLLEDSTDEVVTLHDLSDTKQFPTKGILDHFRDTILATPKNVRLSVGVGTPRLLQTLISVVTKVFGGAIAQADTLEEAVEIARREQP